MHNLVINSTSLKLIAKNAFDYNENLVDVVIDGSYNDLSIRNNAFSRCYSLSSIYIGKGTKSLFRDNFGNVISTGLFNSECSSLVNVTLPFIGPVPRYADAVVGQVFG